MQVDQKEAVALLVEGGSVTAKDWNVERVEKAMNDLLQRRDKMSDLSEENELLASKICDALQEGEEIKVVSTEQEDSEDEDTEEKDNEVAQDLHDDEDDEDDDEEEEEEEEDSDVEEDEEELEEKPKKKVKELPKKGKTTVKTVVKDVKSKKTAKDEKVKKPVKAAVKKPAKDEKVKTSTKTKVPAKKGKEDKKPRKKKEDGVCATIINCYRKGSERRPMTKDKILEVLIEKFPERDPEGMKKTVAGSPNWIPSYYNVAVQKNEKGWWIEED